jgi:hypothetical protein
MAKEKNNQAPLTAQLIADEIRKSYTVAEPTKKQKNMSKVKLDSETISILLMALGEKLADDDLVLYTEDETAQKLRTVKSTLRDWRSHKTGPKSTKVGGRVLYSKSNLRKYLKAHEAEVIADGDTIDA